MPYTADADRTPLNPRIDALAEKLVHGTVGDLNYTITRLVAKFLLHKGLKYENVNAVAGVLQKVLAEFDARVTRPYEEEKILQNGDIPEYAEIDRQVTRMHGDMRADDLIVIKWCPTCKMGRYSLESENACGACRGKLESMETPPE